jgi:hypothetical protein
MTVVTGKGGWQERAELAIYYIPFQTFLPSLPTKYGQLGL